MDTKRVPAKHRPCCADDCAEPRHVTSSGFVISYCLAHENARNLATKQRLVIDPETGRTTTANLLTWHRSMAKKRAFAAQEQENKS